MISMCFYGDEKLDETAERLIEDLTGKTADEFLDDALRLSPEEAAEAFIDISSRLDYRWTEDDEAYLRNAVALLWRFSEKRGLEFYYALSKHRQNTDELEELPSRARTLILIQ